MQKITFLFVILLISCNNADYIEKLYCYDKVDNKVHRAACVRKIDKIDNLLKYYESCFPHNLECRRSADVGFVKIQEVKILKYINDSIAKIEFMSAGTGRLRNEMNGYVLKRSLHKTSAR